MASQGANSISIVRKIGSANSGLLGTAPGVLSGQWNYLVVTRNANSKLKVWLNGALAFTTSDGNPLSFANDMLVGCSGTPSSRANYFNGLIDEVAVYRRELSTNEIVNQFVAATNGAVAYGPLIKTDVNSEMRNVNSAIYVRIPFVVTNVADVSRLTLRMRYDDGFQAYINGDASVSVNAPDIWIGIRWRQRGGPIWTQCSSRSLTFRTCAALWCRGRTFWESKV